MHHFIGFQQILSYINIILEINIYSLDYHTQYNHYLLDYDNYNKFNDILYLLIKISYLNISYHLIQFHNILINRDKNSKQEFYFLLDHMMYIQKNLKYKSYKILLCIKHMIHIFQHNFILMNKYNYHHLLILF